MKIVLFALNGSRSHTNLAVRCLRRPLEAAGFGVVIAEYDLRDRRDTVLQALYSEHADVYGFSAYIWNITELLGFASDLKALLPDSVCVFGGPEVSYATERFDNPLFGYIDHIVCGEGEAALTELCLGLKDGRKMPRVIHGAAADVMKDEGILYRTDDRVNGDMLYYESSRGCPYGCAYCLSSAMHGVRAKNAEQTLRDLESFSALPYPIKIIKFVDRTFNFDVKRANTIWRALAEESERYPVHCHFEICASLLDEESFEIFAEMPPGKIQLEIGLQSTNPETLREVSRHIEPMTVINAARRIHDMGRIHVHVDLIAGLPYETYDRFKVSFNDAYYCSDMLQLGFLKLLYGTRLRRDADKYGYVCSSAPPYTVLESKWMTRDQLYTLSLVSDLLDRYYSSGAFSRSLGFAVKCAPSPFEFYEGLLNYIEKNDGRSIRSLSQTDAFRMLHGYASALNADLSELERLMRLDYSDREARKLPMSVIAPHVCGAENARKK